MHGGDLVGVGQVERIEAAIDEDALRVQQRPHRAVADEDALVESLEEWFQWGGATSRSALSQMKSSLL